MKFLHIFLILFIYGFTFAQLDLNLGPDWNFTGVGARAAGMGGAFIGVSDDATAISWNPAGLTQLDEPEASVVGRGLVEKYEVDFDYYTETYEDEHGILNFLSGVYPFEFSGKQFVAALAVQRQLDLYSYYHEEYLYEEASGSTEYLYETFSEGGASTIEVYLDSYYYWDYYDRSDLTFSGVNFVCGAILDFNYSSNPFPLKIGLVVKTSFSLEVEETFSLEETTNDNGEISGYYPDDATSSHSLGMPLMVGAGISYRFSDNFTLAVDMESRKYGETTLKEDYADLIGLDMEEEDELIIIENQDLNQLRFGGEYLFTEIWDFAVIPLRIGAQTYPTLFMDNNDEQVVGGGLSLGTGLITDRYSLDISYKNTEFEIEYGDDDDDDDFIYKKTMNTLTLSCIYYF
jgi:hypothetical protein